MQNLGLTKHLLAHIRILGRKNPVIKTYGFLVVLILVCICMYSYSNNNGDYCFVEIISHPFIHFQAHVLYTYFSSQFYSKSSRYNFKMCLHF